MNEETETKVRNELEGLRTVIGRLGGLWNLYPMRDDVKEQVIKAQSELIEIRKNLIRLGMVSRTLGDNPQLGRRRRLK